MIPDFKLTRNPISPTKYSVYKRLKPETVHIQKHAPRKIRSVGTRKLTKKGDRENGRRVFGDQGALGQGPESTEGTVFGNDKSSGF